MLHPLLAYSLGLGAAGVAGHVPSTPTKDPVRMFIESKRTLSFEPKQGYLRALLSELGISPASQVLVFSKSSFQTDFISPKTPRAIYFNANTYVGWIPGAPVMEIMTVDPKEGTQFYVLENRKSKGLKFEQPFTLCTRCHGGRSPESNAQLIAESNIVPASGYPNPFVRSVGVTARTPIEKRWGGWYVTGTHGQQVHRGNILATGSEQAPQLDPKKGANKTSLVSLFNVNRYLTPHSDIAALMVMEQQMSLQNLLGQLALDTRGFREVEPYMVEPVVRELLNVGEAKLTAPIQGTSGFAAWFAKQFPRDSKGRSLGDLDLTRRIQKIPCQPLVYSEAFRGLSDITRRRIWERLAVVLSEGDRTPAYAHLTSGDRQAIREVLTETIPESAPYFAQAAFSRPRVRGR